ncbi:MAG TPA: hypothetical protein VMT96_00735 [Candidatus Bathyarchaeia archaeon]|nr:hypothetical protein [Candidatus Bathyarchaeia archaeon]
MANREFAEIYTESTSELDNFGPMSHVIKMAKSMQHELRERQLSEDDEMIFAIGAVALFNDYLERMDDPHQFRFWMQRVFMPAKYAPDGLIDLSGEHQAAGHASRFIYRRILELPTYAVVLEDSDLYSYDRPIPSVYTSGNRLILPVKSIDMTRNRVN